jgi:hypothetical protein
MLIQEGCRINIVIPAENKMELNICVRREKNLPLNLGVVLSEKKK